MSTEELLKPRYKVIADYPKSLYNVGDILNAGWRSEDCIYCDTEGPRWRHFPHLFKKLYWWEDRSTEDLPEYIKWRNDQGSTTVFNIMPKTYLDKGFMKWKFGGRTLKQFLPSTESEYNNCLTDSK